MQSPSSRAQSASGQRIYKPRNAGGWGTRSVKSSKEWKFRSLIIAASTPTDARAVQVREPRVSFGGMQYNFDKYDLGDSVFFLTFNLQLSALLVPFETAVHLCMGKDEVRVAQSGAEAFNPEDDACQGMMKQETNHGQCQLLYSKAAEEILEYPSGWRKLWKIVILDVLPLPVRQAFICWLEAGFIAMTSVLAALPGLYDRLYGEPKWVFAWHLSEEAEHCWDSVSASKS